MFCITSPHNRLSYDCELLIQNTLILISGQLKNFGMCCEKVLIISLSHSYTIAIGTDKIYSSMWDTFHEVIVDFRVPFTAVTRFVNEHISKRRNKTNTVSYMYIYTNVLMYGLINFALYGVRFYLFIFFFNFLWLLDIYVFLFSGFLFNLRVYFYRILYQTFSQCYCIF